MSDEDEEHSVRKPYHGPERRAFPAALAVVALFVVVAAVFALITWLRYST